MKKITKYMGIFVIMIVSFFYTEKVALIVQNKNPIMKDINDIFEEKKVKYVNALIDGNKIIPGKNGLEIDKENSFYAMKMLGKFNEYYLSYKEIQPKISLKDNKDKIIVSGNSANKKVSIIIGKDEKIIEYFVNKNIKINLLVDKNIIYQQFELINNDVYNFDYVESLLNRKNINSNICVLNDNIYIEKICKNNNKYLVKTDIILNDGNVIDIKNSICNGSIIYIEDNTRIEYIDFLLDEIKFKGLEVVPLSKLIDEKNSN